MGVNGTSGDANGPLARPTVAVVSSPPAAPDDGLDRLRREIGDLRAAVHLLESEIVRREDELERLRARIAVLEAYEVQTLIQERMLDRLEERTARLEPLAPRLQAAAAAIERQRAELAALAERIDSVEAPERAAGSRRLLHAFVVSAVVLAIAIGAALLPLAMP